jgi:agmatine deiminase
VQKLASFADVSVMLHADWHEHSCCYLAWALHPEWGRSVRDVKAELRNVIATIAEYEPVRLLAPPDQIDEAKQQSFGPSVQIIEAPVDDIWMRDIAPTLARRGAEIVAIDWNFNGWGSTRDRRARPGDKLAKTFVFGDVRVNAPFVAEGGAFITDGKGTIVTTRSCLLNSNRNKGSATIDIEEGLRSLGGRRVIWLEGDDTEPITSGHVDGYVLFGESGEVAVEAESGVDPIADATRVRDINTLRSSTDADGNSLNVRLVAPPRTRFSAGKSALFAPAYLNAYIANGAVITAKFGDRARDELARLALQTAFPSRQVRMIDINHIAAGGGGIRCLTQPVLSRGIAQSVAAQTTYGPKRRADGAGTASESNELRRRGDRGSSASAAAMVCSDVIGKAPPHLVEPLLCPDCNFSAPGAAFRSGSLRF